MNDPEDRRLRIERDLYRDLLRFGGATDPRPFLEEALRRVVAAAGSHQGYLALYRAQDLAAEPDFWIARDCTAQEVAQVRASLSRGIVREAVERGETISTACALEDPRFREQESVAVQGIRAVLCAPVAGALGVIYLQGRDQPGPFGEQDRRLLEDFARQVAPYAERLLEQDVAEDPTLPFRKQLKGLEHLAGRSDALAALFNHVALVAPLEVTVLLQGPSGAGKTALARAIHLNSPRAPGPFLELNCAAIPEGLVESELFGAEKGAHSTADRRLTGKVEGAAGGTLFLDEVGELPLASQAKLLQFLQEKRYFPLGGDRALEADVRILAATNRDLIQAVAAREFREDLYYRLAVLPMEVPPLSRRPGDVVPIASALVAAAALRNSLPALELSPAARSSLEACDWPGNVRQLANTLEAGLIRAAGARAATITPGHLFPGEQGEEEEPSFQAATRAFQRRLLQETLECTSWNVSAAARKLDLSRSHLNELLHALGLKRPSYTTTH